MKKGCTAGSGLKAYQLLQTAALFITEIQTCTSNPWVEAPPVKSSHLFNPVTVQQGT